MDQGAYEAWRGGATLVRAWQARGRACARAGSHRCPQLGFTSPAWGARSHGRSANVSGASRVAEIDRRRRRRRDVFKECSNCPEMVVIAAGMFDMGSPSQRVEERPYHKV